MRFLVRLFVLAACSFTASSTAQGFTMPAGYETKTGDPAAVLIPHPTGHLQLCYGSHQGSIKVALVKRLSFRRESAVGLMNFARKWTKVTLRVGNCDFTKLSDIFTHNLMSPTTVFTTAVSWPATSGKPKTSPPPWGKFASTTSFDVSFPFSSSFVHLGKMGFAADFQFAGGVISGSTVWRDYYVAGVRRTNTVMLNTFANYGNRACRATGRTAASFLSIWMWSNNIPGAGKKRFRPSFWGKGFPNNAKFIGALGVAGSTVATPFLTSCQGLHVSFSKPVIIVTGRADGTGFYWGPYFDAPYDSTIIGLKVWTQAAFDDASRLQLTMGSALTITAAPTGTPEYGARLYSAQLGGYMPGAWGDLCDIGVPIIYLH